MTANEPKKSWLCRLGLHDWEVIESRALWDIRADLQLPVHRSDLMQEVRDRVCLRPGCGQVSLQLTEAISQYKQRRAEKQERKAKARQLYREHDSEPGGMPAERASGRENADA